MEQSNITCVQELPGFSPDVVAAAAGAKIFIYDLRTDGRDARSSALFHDQEAMVLSLLFDSKLQQIVAGGRFPSLTLNDIRMGRISKAIYTGTTTSDMTDLYNGYIVNVGHRRGNGTVSIYDLSKDSNQTGSDQLFAKSRGGFSVAPILGVASSPLKSRIVTCSADGTLLLWDELGLECLRAIGPVKICR